INGSGPDGSMLSSYTELAEDGSTACGCWIYCGVYADGVNQAARRKPGQEQHWVAPEWGWAWPSNRRILYNRASADPDGNPWSERKAYVWWDPDANDGAGSWTGYDNPDFIASRPPDYVPEDGATGPDAIGGRDPLVMQTDGKAWLFAPAGLADGPTRTPASVPGSGAGGRAASGGRAPCVMQTDGKAWLFAPAGLADGPMPTHYEEPESPVVNPLYAQQNNPARRPINHETNPINPSFSS